MLYRHNPTHAVTLPFVYAPFSSVTAQPGDDFRGVIWANDVTVSAGGNVYLDDVVKDTYLGNALHVVGWKEQRDF